MNPRLRSAASRRAAPLVGALLASIVPWYVSAQERPPTPIARGLYNWVHTTADAERAFAFYRDVLGLELARSPFVGAAAPDAPPERIRPAAEAGSDPLVWDLTNTHGSRFRTVFMRAANTPFGLELAEFFDIPRETRAANPWDPGASRLRFAVRDLESIVAKLHGRASPVVTLGGRALGTTAGLAILVRDPDGYLVEIRQATAAELARVTVEADVIDTSIGITVAELGSALEFYRGLLGMAVGETRLADAAELRLNGLAGGELRQTAVSIAGTAITVVISEFRLPAEAPPAVPFRWRIQDVGAPQFQLEVADLEALLARTTKSGYSILSRRGRPIERPFGRFVFAIDVDGVLVEFVEPAAAR